MRRCQPDQVRPERRLAATLHEADGRDSVYRDLVEAAQCMIVILRPDRSIAYFNTYAAELTGHRPDDVLGRDFFAAFLPASIKARIEAEFCRALKQGGSCDIEHLLLAKGGSTRWVVSSLRGFTDGTDEPAVLLTAQDITARKHTEEALQQRTHDLGERIKELNCLFGLSKLVEEPGIDLEGIFQGLVDMLPPAWQYPGETCARIVFSGREYKTYNFQPTRWKQTAPTFVYGAEVGAIEVYYLEEKPEACEGPFLAEERRLIDALAEQLGRIAERRAMEKEIADISTREQQRIGQELHDGLGQELTGLGYLAETLSCDLKKRGAQEAETADRLSRGIEHALEQARNIARGLVPMEIDADGLISALGQLAAATEQHCGIACRFHATGAACVPDTAAATQVFRIVQEAVNNAAKHAKARQITIQLDGGRGQTTFRVRDDGIGITRNQEHASGMGLQIMQHRAGVIGATLTVQAADGGGTVVACTLPGSEP